MKMDYSVADTANSLSCLGIVFLTYVLWTLVEEWQDSLIVFLEMPIINYYQNEIFFCFTSLKLETVTGF